MKKLTIFTPTYNRAYLIPALYDSLLSQTCKDFCWLIIDDGSTDGTQALVKQWIKDGKIDIEYIYQNNKGMVGAHNTAHYKMSTELCVCIDSDDYMPADAVAEILFLWDEYGYPECAGLIGLDAYKNGSIVGDKFPKDLKECKFSELSVKYKVLGDKKFVHNRKVFNKYLPYPFIDDEKFPVTSYLYLFIEQEHKYLVFNKVFCIVEYLPDGLSMNLINQYRNSPKSFALYRIARMKYALNYKDKFKNAIHYVSSSLIAKNKRFVKESPCKCSTLFAILPGILLYLYITKTHRKSINMKLNKN